MTLRYAFGYSVHFSYIEQYSNQSGHTEYNSGLRLQLPTKESKNASNQNLYV
jgi:hypothetical protein